MDILKSAEKNEIGGKWHGRLSHAGSGTAILAVTHGLEARATLVHLGASRIGLPKAAGLAMAAIAAMAILLWATGCGSQQAAENAKPGRGATPYPSPSRQKTLYTCGMHPEVVQDHPGNCPKCGMKLVPMDPDRARTILKARGEAVDEGPPEEARPSGSSSGESATGATAKKERKVLY